MKVSVNDEDELDPAEALLSGEFGEYRPSALDGDKVQIHRRSTLGDPDEAPTFNSAAADAAQIGQLEREIATLREQLAETNGYDPETGNPVYLITGHARDGLLKKLEHLQTKELPFVRARQQEAARWREANVPTPEQKLQAEAEARAAVRARAEERALEIEVEEEARRIVAERRKKLSS